MIDREESVWILLHAHSPSSTETVLSFSVFVNVFYLLVGFFCTDSSKA